MLNTNKQKRVVNKCPHVLLYPQILDDFVMLFFDPNRHKKKGPQIAWKIQCPSKKHISITNSMVNNMYMVNESLQNIETLGFLVFCF